MAVLISPGTCFASQLRPLPPVQLFCSSAYFGIASRHPKSRSVRPLDSFARGISRNHFHVWWGENYTVEQVSNNAEPPYGVKQGDWPLTDEFPVYHPQTEDSGAVPPRPHTPYVNH